MQKEFFPNAFPNIIYKEHPMRIPGIPQSIYICNQRMLRERKDLDVTEHYRQFYYDLPQRLEAIAAKTTNPVLKEWILNVVEKRAFLEIHGNNPSGEGQQYLPNFLIQFTDFKDYQEWAYHFPSYGTALELILPTAIPENLPAALKELYSLGRLYLNGGFGLSGYFEHPQGIRPALEVEHLGDYLLNLESKNDFPITDFKVFYHDSLTWLMYDSKECVYAAGFEFGGLSKSDYNLETVINNILKANQKEGSVFLEECIGGGGELW